MSEFLNAADQQLILRGHNPVLYNERIYAATRVQGLPSEMRFADLDGKFGVCVIEIFALNIEDEMESAMMELASLLNTRTAFCAAFYDPDEASLMVRASAPLHDSANFDQIVELLVENVASTAKQFVKLAIPVLREIMTPSQAVATVIDEQPE